MHDIFFQPKKKLPKKKYYESDHKSVCGCVCVCVCVCKKNDFNVFGRELRKMTNDGVFCIFLPR